VDAHFGLHSARVCRIRTGAIAHFATVAELIAQQVSMFRLGRLSRRAMVIHGHPRVRYRSSSSLGQEVRGVRGGGGNRLGPLTSVAWSSPCISKETASADATSFPKYCRHHQLLSHPRQHAFHQLPTEAFSLHAPKCDQCAAVGATE